MICINVYANRYLIETLYTSYQMKNKQSRGADEISSQLLKVIRKEICKSLTLIINQMIETGIYPENFKIAKIQWCSGAGTHGNGVPT